MVSFVSITQCVAMYLMVSTLVSSVTAAPPQNRSKTEVAAEIANLLAAAIRSGLIQELAPDVIAKIKSGDFSSIPAGIFDKLKSHFPSDSSNGRFVNPNCPTTSGHASATGPKPSHTPVAYNELD